MLETVLGLSSSATLGIVGVLALVVNIITEILKKIVPQSFPTKALTLIVSFFVTILVVIIFCAISVKTIIMGVLGSFIIAFIAMYGWDTFNELIKRFKYPS